MCFHHRATSDHIHVTHLSEKTDALMPIVSRSVGCVAVYHSMSCCKFATCAAYLQEKRWASDGNCKRHSSTIAASLLAHFMAFIVFMAFIGFTLIHFSCTTTWLMSFFFLAFVSLGVRNLTLLTVHKRKCWKTVRKMKDASPSTNSETAKNKKRKTWPVTAKQLKLE